MEIPGYKFHNLCRWRNSQQSFRQVTDQTRRYHKKRSAVGRLGASQNQMHMDTCSTDEMARCRIWYNKKFGYGSGWQGVTCCRVNRSHTTQRSCPRQALARAVGRIVSLHMAFGDLVYAKTKQSHMQISTSPTWDENITPSSNTRLELEFWKKFFYMANGQDIIIPASAIEVKFTPKRSNIQADIRLPYTVPPLHRSIKRQLLPQHNLMTNEFLFMIDIINNLGSWAAHSKRETQLCIVKITFALTDKTGQWKIA